MKTYVNNLNKNHRQLLTLFGTLKEIVLPSEEEIESKVAEIFGNCKVDLLEIPFTLECARSSFEKTIKKLPPSDRDQQFKDGVIWADCLNLLKTDDVYLVTSDNAFYTERNCEKGIAKPLQMEAESYPNKITLFSNLEKLLNSIKTEVQINNENLVNQFMNATE